MSKSTLPSQDPLAPLSVSDLSLVIHPGQLHEHWAEMARRKGFTLIARVRDRLHVALRCQSCGGIHVSRHFVVMKAQPLCPHCIETR